MGGKQLDFNRPLLSVRRHPPIPQPENNNKKPENKAFPPVYKSEFRSGPVRNPGTVPFVWEQTPGRPKYETKPPNFHPQHPPLAPRLPPGRPGRTLNTDIQAFEGPPSPLGSQNAPLLDKKKETKQESSRDGTEEETDVPGSEDDREAYVDALDALSRSESFFLNCSVSGVSGLDDGPHVKQWGTFSTDQQTRDFMMGRFLPAAKAMASETPQFSTRKQPEQPRTTSKLFTTEKEHPFNEGRRLTNIPHCNGEEETEDDNVPGMRKQLQAPMTKVRSSHAVYCPENHNEDNKQASIHVHEQKSQSNKIIPGRSYEKELDGSSLYKRLQGNAYKDKFSIPSINEEKRFLGIPETSKDSGVNSFSANAKGGKVFREYLTTECDEWESALSSPLVEKTLYIDSVQMLKPQSINEHRRDDGVTKNGEVEETAFTYSSFQEDEFVTAAKDKAHIQSKSVESADSDLLSSSHRSVDDIKMISTSEARPKVDPSKMQSTKLSDEVDSNLENQLVHIKLSDEKISKGYNSVPKYLPPLPLPLPKSPSESWLKRALPAVSTKHTTTSRSSLGLNSHPRIEASTIESPDLKWETIVKTAKVQHGHLRYSEELLSTIPEV